MYERDSEDFSIEYDENRKTFSIFVGTWSVGSQTLIDVLMFLELNVKDEKSINNFRNKLNKDYNDMFISNKEVILNDIKSFNFMNSIIGDLDELIIDYEYSDRKEEYLKENEIYVLDEKKLDNYLDNEYKEVIKEIILKSNNILELYDNCMILKERIQDEIYSDLFSYLKKELI